MDTESLPLDLTVTVARRNAKSSSDTGRGSTSNASFCGHRIPPTRESETSQVNRGIMGHPRLIRRDFSIREPSSFASRPTLFCEGKGASNGLVRQCRKRPSTHDMVCRVCGDRAFGYNFNVITCESCKAFFRRNALKPQQRECKNKGECLINILTRRFCPACRLRKCFFMGMNPELILNSRRLKAKENLVRRASKEPCDSNNQELEEHGARLCVGRGDGANERLLHPSKDCPPTGPVFDSRTMLNIPGFRPQLPMSPCFSIIAATPQLFNQAPQ